MQLNAKLERFNRCISLYAAPIRRFLRALRHAGLPVSLIMPHTLGGESHNIWNRSIQRILIYALKLPTHEFDDTYVDCHLNLRLRPQCRKPLWDFVRNNGCKNILEIGLGTGENMEKMLDLAGDDCDYYCFDNLSLSESWDTFQKLKDRKNVHFHIGDTKKTLPKVVGNLPMMDLIYIDGGHDYDVAKSDWENCKRLMHSKTAVFFHDYFPCLGVKNVVDEIGDGFSVEIINPGVGPLFALVSLKNGGVRNV